MVAPRQTLVRHAIRGLKTTATFGGRSAAKNARDSATDSAMRVMPRDAQGYEAAYIFSTLVRRHVRAKKRLRPRGVLVRGATEYQELDQERRSPRGNMSRIAKI
ncbi:MAG: hypothetical protein NT013_15665 [Planctomycetia bacterium]|nr:hypothetical protein [Planctomycetia bacterium]